MFLSHSHSSSSASFAKACHLWLVIFIFLHIFHIVVASRCLIIAGIPGDSAEWVCTTCLAVNVCSPSMNVTGWRECRASRRILGFLSATQCGLYMTNQICQTASVLPPLHVRRGNLASIIIAPQGELPKFLPSSFVRNEALLFPAIGWNMSFDIKSHRFPLAAWPRQMFVIFIYVIGDDPAAQRCRDLAADSHVMLIMSNRVP